MKTTLVKSTLFFIAIVLAMSVAVFLQTGGRATGGAQPAAANPAYAVVDTAQSECDASDKKTYTIGFLPVH